MCMCGLQKLDAFPRASKESKALAQRGGVPGKARRGMNSDQEEERRIFP